MDPHPKCNKYIQHCGYQMMRSFYGFDYQKAIPFKHNLAHCSLKGHS